MTGGQLLQRVNKELFGTTDTALKILEDSLKPARRTKFKGIRPQLIGIYSKQVAEGRSIRSITSDIENQIAEEFDLELMHGLFAIRSDIGQGRFLDAYQATDALISSVDEASKYQEKLIAAMHKIKRNTPSGKQSRRAVLTTLGQAILAESVLRTPIHTGKLRASARLIIPPTNDTILIFYSEPYALYVHENLTFKHPTHVEYKFIAYNRRANKPILRKTGNVYDCYGKAKFLEDAVQNIYRGTAPSINEGHWGESLQTDVGQLFIEIPIDWGDGA